MNPLESNLEMCVKDVVDLGRKIEDSLAKIRVNKQRAGELAVHSRDIITKLQDCADGKLNNTPPIALVGALNDLKLQLKRIHNECQPVISAHIWAGAQPLKLSMKRATFEAEVKELKQHGDKCYALFASLRKGAPSIDVARGTEDLSSEIADITARMEGSGLEIKHIPQVEGHVPEIAEGIDQIERGVHYAETVHYPSVQAPQMSYSGVHVSQRPNDRADVNISGGIGGDGGRGGNIGGQGGVGEGNKIEIKASHNRSVQFFNLPDPEAQKTLQSLEYHHREIFKIIEAGERDKIIEYLSPVNFFTRQADIYGTRQPGTGSELLEHNHFKQWKDSMDRKILRCCGMPGVGKTVLVSMVVEQLRTEFRHKNVGVACIYLDHKEIQSHSLPNLFAALWQQLVFEIPIAAGSPVHRLYQEHHEKRTRPTLAQSYELLTTIISKLSQVFILVDALDEYPEDQRNVLLKYLTDINDPPIKLLLAARPNISLSFPNITTVNISGSQKDIRKYLHQKITESKHLSSHVKKSPELRREIITKILDAVGGMFLLARLHIGSLATATEPKDVREALENLQRDLPLVYADIMQRIDSQDKGDRQLAHSVLTWVANAKRPLLVGELREALATQLRSEVNINGILSVCAGLVTVDNIHNPIVRLIHHTTQTYLDSIQETHFPRAQTDITLTCLTYLSSKDISTLNCFSYFEKQDFLRQHQLIGYAQYWLLHARGQPEKDLQKEIVVFLETASEWYRFWSTLDPREYVEPWDYTWHAGLTLTPFWFSASSNLLHITKSLLVQTPYISEEMQSSVLYGAAYYHHLHMLQLLLENGLNVNARGHYGTVLHIASYWGLEEIVRLLIRYGADVNIQGGPCGTALGAALYQAHDRNQTLHLASPDAQTPQNYETIIQILIYHGANGNLNIVQSDSYNSYAIPLHAASQGGSREIVGGLIRNEANINFEGQSETAHHAVAHVGFTDIVQVGMPLDPLPPPPPQVAQPPTLHDLYKAIYSVEVPKSNTATSCSVPLDNWNVIRSLAAALLQKPETPADLDTSISTKLDALASKLDSISSQIPQPTPTSGSILHKTYTSVAASHPATYTARERSCDVILTPKDRLNKVFTIETPHAIQQQLNTVIMGSPRLNKHTQVPFVRATAKHRNGDIRLTLQSSHAAALLMEEVDHWLPTFSSLLQLRTLTFPIIMHRVPTSFNIGSGLPSHADEWESDIAVLVKANETYMNTGDLARVHWISRQTSDELRKAKQHSSLVLHFKSADAANKCITHKLALYGHLHRTEKYYPQPQCFNCYCFGHTASQCRHL